MYLQRCIKLKKKNYHSYLGTDKIGNHAFTEIYIKINAENLKTKLIITDKLRRNVSEDESLEKNNK